MKVANNAPEGINELLEIQQFPIGELPYPSQKLVEAWTILGDHGSAPEFMFVALRWQKIMVFQDLTFY